jgi:deoxyribodipyrimidine photo-lyase
MMSAYLSQGCLSPKKLFYEVAEFAAENNRDDLLERIFQKLMYRDHLRLVAKKYGDRIFQQHGTTMLSAVQWRTDPEIFSQWATGNTGGPLVDAIMHQLVLTGLCNHKSRKLVANFLIRELGYDWRKGASFFESLLVDYDPCSNWVNWMNLAGLGPDSREVRPLNYELQEKRLDPNGTFITKWANA